MDVEAILSIPISSKLLGDRLIWAGTNKLASLFEVHTRWQCSFTSQEMLLQPHLIANNGLFGINYGTYRSFTRFAILLGELVVRYFPLRRTYEYVEYYWIALVKNVV